MPSRAYRRAVFSAGFSPVMSWTHWVAESACWSNWPGRYSTAKVWQSASSAANVSSSSQTMSAFGSKNTVSMIFSLVFPSVSKIVTVDKADVFESVYAEKIFKI